MAEMNDIVKELNGTEVAQQGIAGDCRAQAGRLALGRVKMILSGSAFFLLTAGIFWHQFHRIQTGEARPEWNRLR